MSATCRRDIWHVSECLSMLATWPCRGDIFRTVTSLVTCRPMSFLPTWDCQLLESLLNSILGKFVEITHVYLPLPNSQWNQWRIHPSSPSSSHYSADPIADNDLIETNDCGNLATTPQSISNLSQRRLPHLNRHVQLRYLPYLLIKSI
mgnify:CR=1 FL=1